MAENDTPQNQEPAENTAPSAEAPAPQSVNVLNPDGQLVSIPQEQLQDALSSGYSQASPEHIEQYAKEQKYGTVGQQIKTGLEGLAQGVAGPLATSIETGTGLATPEDIRGREEINPGIHALSETAGFIGPAVASGGVSAAAKLGLEVPEAVSAGAKLLHGYSQAGVIGEAGNLAREATGVTKGAGFLHQVAADTVQGAFEAALYQGGEELSRKFKEDPSQTAESAIADMGLAAVMGGAFGGAIGAGLRSAGIKEIAEEAAPAFVSEVDRPAVEAGDFKATIKNSNILKPSEKTGILEGLGKEKSDAPDIRAAAERLGAPVMEGMVSDSKLVQKAEDALINGVPTYSGLKRQQLYTDGYNLASGAVDASLGEGSELSKAQIGNYFKESITKDLERQNAPIKAMYDKIKQVQDIIPVPNRLADDLMTSLKDIKELRIAPSSEEGKMVQRVLSEIGNSKTVDDLKAYKSTIDVSPTASSGAKRMAGILRDKIETLEESAIEKYASNTASRMNNDWAPGEFEKLVADRNAAKGVYKEFINKVKTLSEQLGKGRVYGVQDAINFIKNLTPEEVTQKLFSKNNSEFLKYFSKNFPEQMTLMREYQKGLLKEQASKQGTFSARTFFNNFNKLEPEIQQSVFTKEELSKIKDAETYIRSMPKNFNPSGTSNMNAMRQFFEHPMGAAIANARDLGIEKFIKAVSASPRVAQAVSLAKSTVAGERLALRAVKAVFSDAKDAMPAAVIPLSKYREKLDGMVDKYSASPEKMLGMGDSTPVASYAQAFAATSARAVQYLNTLRPDLTPKSPLDARMPANAFQKAAYNRALDIAQQPLVVLNRMKEGTLTPSDVEALKSIYPSVYNTLVEKITSNMVDQVAKGSRIPYQTRMQLSMFLGQPLDSTLTPMAIQSAQSRNIASQNSQQAQTMPGGKHTTSGLDKLATEAQTPVQARAAARSNNK